MTRCMLCNDLCKRHESHLELSFDFTLEEIARSALHDGCESCLVIHEGLRQTQREKWPQFATLVKRVFARCHGEYGGYGDTLHLVIVFINEAPSLRLEFYSLKPTAWKAILPRSTISSNPLSTRAVTWARARLVTCNQTHVSCSTGRAKQLPKRLLSLERNSKGDIDVKLFEVKSNFSSAYAALSHCWGKERGLLTTARTLKSRKKRIPWLVIPDTFQDAIKLALKLNIGFIWIDSLCILQDDLNDWEVESSKMAGIYQHAVLTLAATTSSSSLQGAYSRYRSVAKHTEIVLPEARVACRIGVRERVRHWNKTTANDEKQFPLLSRGWVLQERLLSPRILHFCDTELIWECREVSDCECGALNQDRSPGAVFYNLTKSFDEQQTQTGSSVSTERLPSLWDRVKAKSPSSKIRNSWLGPASSPLVNVSSTTTPTRHTMDLGRPQPAQAAAVGDEVIPDFVSHYHRLVEQYSSLKLTRPTDRLPAFSGLAERMQHFRAIYLAGLWSDSLCFDLMWRIDMHDLWDTMSTRPLEYSGPTWSWITAIARVKYWSATINYTDTVQRFLRELANSRSETSGSDRVITTTTPLLLNKAKTKFTVNVPGRNRFGSVNAGVLVVEASAVSATLRYTHHYVSTTTRIAFTNNAGQADKYRIRYHAEVEYGDADDANVFVDLFADYILNLPGPAEICEGAELTLLLVHPDVALVLRRKIKGNKYVYIEGEVAWERIGIARVWDEIPGYGTVDWMMYSQVKTFRIV